MSDIAKKSHEPIANTDGAEIHLLRPRFREDSGFPFVIGQHTTQIANDKARFAMVCIERWGMVAADIDGEDSAGRSKLRRLSPDEVVRDACDAADAAYAEFEKRGWLTKIPPSKELVEILKQRENAND